MNEVVGGASLERVKGERGGGRWRPAHEVMVLVILIVCLHGQQEELTHASAEKQTASGEDNACIFRICQDPSDRDKTSYG